MFRRKSDDANQSNFWISYADLMAGLLFVFILLIGAIVSKSIILREDLRTKESKLSATERSLNQKEQALKKLTTQLKKREEALRATSTSLKQSEQAVGKHQQTIAAQKKKIRLQAEEVTRLHRLLAELQASYEKEKKQTQQLTSRLKASEGKVVASGKKIKELESLIILTKDSLKLKEDELEKLNQLLLARNSKIDTLNKKVILLQNLTTESNTTLTQKQKKLQEYANRVIVLSNTLTKKEDELKLKDQKLADLLDALDKKKTRYDDLLAKLKSQRAKIKSLTGIQLKVIAALKETLGGKINIDRKSGALRLASKILFDRGSSILKEGSKVELRTSFEEYIGALVTNEAIRPHLDRIVIEGHTDSDGSYLYNLALSQKRALAVMNYLLTLPIAKKYDLEKFLVASGRSFQDRLFRGGVEDKEASRRIEIKFQLKNQDAMHEIERILDHGEALF